MKYELQAHHEPRTWSKFKEHERSVNDGSAVRFEEIELQEDKEQLSMQLALASSWPP